MAPLILPAQWSHAPARLSPLPSPTRRYSCLSCRRTSLRLLRAPGASCGQPSLPSTHHTARLNSPPWAPQCCVHCATFARLAPPPCRAGLEKGPTPPVSSPKAGAGRRLKKARHQRVKLAFRPRRQKQGPLRGASHWGVPQAPASMPRLKKARSSSSGSAACRWSATTPSQGRLRRVTIGACRPQTPA